MSVLGGPRGKVGGVAGAGGVERGTRPRRNDRNASTDNLDEGTCPTSFT